MDKELDCMCTFDASGDADGYHESFVFEEHLTNYVATVDPTIDKAG